MLRRCARATQLRKADSERVRERGVVDQGEGIVETISRQGGVRLEGEGIPISDRRRGILKGTVQVGREEKAEVLVHGEGKPADYIAVLPEVSPWTEGLMEIRRRELDGGRLCTARAGQGKEEETDHTQGAD
jgi:hypothetical protein